MTTHIKGMAVLDARKYVLENFGPEGEAKVKAAMTEADRKLVFADTLLPISWVDLSAAVNHLIAMDQALGKGDMALSEKMLCAIAETHIRGVLRFFFKFVSPKVLMGSAPAIWKQYYDQGQMIIESSDDTRALLKLVGQPDVPLHHEYLSVPYFKYVLGKVSKNVTAVHSQCVARGDAECIFEFTY